MADCPKCGAHIKVYQMSPYCKKCGVHLMFASFEGQFEKDRRIAEMSMAFFRYNLAKLKSAYVSGIFQKLKIAAVFFPLIALFIPFGFLSVSSPLYSSHISFNVLGLFYGPLFGNGLFGRLDGLSVAPVYGEVASSLKLLIIVYAIIAVSAVIILLSELLSFIGNKKTSVAIIVFSVTGIIGCIAFGILSSSLINACSAAAFAECECGIMCFLGALMFVFPLTVAICCLFHPPVCVFRDGDELRVSYRRQYRKGLIELMDIPAPIYESDEEKRERSKLISEVYNINEEKEVAEGVSG